MITDRPSNNGATGSTLQNKGSSVAETAANVKEEVSSKLNQLGSMASDKFSEAQTYVRERGFQGLSADISSAAARHPLGAVAVSLGVGYFVGRLLTPTRR